MSCKIEIEDHQLQYHPGSTIKGKLICTFIVEQSITDITIELVGKEHTGWHKTVDRDVGNTLGYTACLGSNTFLCIEKRLCETDVFGVGSYNFPFTIVLPKYIPGTYFSSLGSTKYYLLGKVHPPNYTVYISDVVDIIVFSQMDIEDVNINYLTPFNDDVEAEFYSRCCFPNPPDRVSMNLFMPQRALIKGKDTYVIAHVANLNQLDMREIELTVGQMTEYKVDTPQKDIKRHLEIIFRESKNVIRRNKVRIFLLHDEVSIATNVVIATNISGTQLPTVDEMNALLKLRRQLDDAGVSYNSTLVALRGIRRIGTVEELPSIQVTPATTNQSESTPQRPSNPSNSPSRSLGLQPGVRISTSNSRQPPTRPLRRPTNRPDSRPSNRPASRPDIAMSLPEIPIWDNDAPPPSYESICGDTSRRIALFAPSAPSEALSGVPSAPNPEPYPPITTRASIRMPMPLPAISSSLPSIGASLYPPETAPLPTADDLSRWDRLISIVTNVAPTISSSDVPTSLPVTPMEPGTSTVAQSSSPMIAVASDNNTERVQEADNSCSPPSESAKPPEGLHSSPASAVLHTERSEDLYPPESSKTARNTIGFIVGNPLSGIATTDNSSSLTSGTITASETLPRISGGINSTLIETVARTETPSSSSPSAVVSDSNTALVPDVDDSQPPQSELLKPPEGLPSLLSSTLPRIVPNEALNTPRTFYNGA